MARDELKTQVPIEEQIQNDLGIKIPEYMSYPTNHQMAGTRFEATQYDRDAKFPSSIRNGSCGKQ